MEKVGIGVIGSGSIAEIAHFPSIKEIPEARLIAVCDIDKTRAEKAAEKWGAEKWYTDYRELLANPLIDLVIIATPNHLHYEQAIAAAEAGKHAIVEKPLACTNKEAWEMVKKFREKGLTLMVGTNQRFWLQHQWARELIEAGVIGKVYLGRTSLHEGWNLYHEQISFTKFRQYGETAGGGAIFDLGAHRIDLLMWMMGSKPKRVVGIAKRLATPETYTKLDDVFVVVIEFEDNKYGIVTGDRYSPAVSNIGEFYGTEGTIFVSSEAQNPFQSAPLAVFTSKDYDWETLPDLLKKYRHPLLFWAEDIINKPVPKRWVSIVPPREWSYKRMLKHFIESISKGVTPMIRPEDGAMAVEIMCATFKSMETGKWVELPLEEEVVPPFYKKYYEERGK
ncbi:MAG TPA: Gfo/Idh/MocA family oxidoreductase [Archaeoglobus sp.]|nr:Gfo/Idh/MocA family oxidoreductase [Archaeoglobus sp.]